MAHAVRRPDLQSLPRGRAAMLAVATIVLGPVALASAALEINVFTAWTGTVAMLLGAWSQMISENRAERFATVIGATAGAVAVMIAASEGGWF